MKLKFKRDESFAKIIFYSITSWILYDFLNFDPDDFN